VVENRLRAAPPSPSGAPDSHRDSDSISQLDDQSSDSSADSPRDSDSISQLDNQSTSLSTAELNAWVLNQTEAHVNATSSASHAAVTNTDANRSWAAKAVQFHEQVDAAYQQAASLKKVGRPKSLRFLAGELVDVFVAAANRKRHRSVKAARLAVATARSNAQFINLAGALVARFPWLANLEIRTCATLRTVAMRHDVAPLMWIAQSLLHDAWTGERADEVDAECDPDLSDAYTAAIKDLRLFHRAVCVPNDTNAHIMTVTATRAQFAVAIPRPADCSTNLRDRKSVV
jgi:hypothetical protein